MKQGQEGLTIKKLNMSKGKVKWYDEVKGFGFILSEEGKDIFVHRSGLVSPFSGLEPDQNVHFEIKEGDRGPVAVKVNIEY